MTFNLYFCFQDDGNVIDAALMAIVSALQDLKLPNVTFNDQEEKVVDLNTKENAVELLKLPVSTTYGEFGGALLLDPTLKECELGR